MGRWRAPQASGSQYITRAGADRLRAEYTPVLGVRSLDILHVAIALSLHAKTFLTFDDRQRALAVQAGLIIVP